MIHEAQDFTARVDQLCADNDPAKSIGISTLYFDDEFAIHESEWEQLRDEARSSIRRAIQVGLLARETVDLALEREIVDSENDPASLLLYVIGGIEEGAGPSGREIGSASPLWASLSERLGRYRTDSLWRALWDEVYRAQHSAAGIRWEKRPELMESPERHLRVAGPPT